MASSRHARTFPWRREGKPSRRAEVGRQRPCGSPAYAYDGLFAINSSNGERTEEEEEEEDEAQEGGQTDNGAAEKTTTPCERWGGQQRGSQRRRPLRHKKY